MLLNGRLPALLAIVFVAASPLRGAVAMYEPDPDNPNFMLGLLHGSLLATDESAVLVAEVLVEYNFGHNEFLLQRPLRAREKDGFWIVEGNRNREGRPGGGPVIIEINKSNCRVRRIDLPYFIEPAP